MRALPIFLFWLLFNSTAVAFISIGTVIDPTAVIYDSPNGKPVGELFEGEQVQVIDGKNGWYEVYVRVPGQPKARNYWVEGYRLDIGNEELERVYNHRYEALKGGHCSKDQDSGAMACVNVRDITLDCKEKAFSNGYELCSIVYELTVESNYAGFESLAVATECQAKVIKNGQTFGALDEVASSYDRFYEPGSQSVFLRTTTNFLSFNPVVKVSLKDPSCRISSVREQ